MSQRQQDLLAWLPGLAAGLYAGRLLGELWAAWTGQTPLWLAVGLTAVAALLAAWSLHRFPFSRTWPALLLLAYVLYPENSLQAALIIALFAFLTWWQLAGLDAGPERAFLADLTPALLLAGFFLLYWFTLAPDVLPADSGELQLAAANLGVAHPPGFPLYTLFGHLVSSLPFGPTPAYRLNLFSAITSTLTLGAVYATIWILTRRRLPAAAAILALGSTTTFWAQATTANIRSMTALFAALIFLALTQFYRAIVTGDSRRADDALIFFALLLSLG
ncbi:MAG: protein O-mannosyl-transferase family, partial [Candidatus Promineifilaceae bacterium]